MNLLKHPLNCRKISCIILLLLITNRFMTSLINSSTYQFFSIEIFTLSNVIKKQKLQHEKTDAEGFSIDSHCKEH